MPGSTFLSSSWFRVSALRPKLREHVSVSRHRYRGRSWYVLHDRATGTTHRLSPASYMVVGGMDGRSTVDDLWRDAAIRLEQEAPSQDEIILLLGQLSSADLLQTDATPDSADLLDRAARAKRSMWLRNVVNPMVFRKRLWYPDRFFDRTVPVVGWLFSRPVALVWLVTVLSGIALAASNWDALTNNALDRILAAENILIIALSYPIIKALHELGHGYALKRFGGAVHEIGIMFLVFFPMPYVDASDASRFRSKWQRALVGAAGMIVEVFLAAIAMWIWVLVEPGLVQAVAYNVMLVAGVSTLLFNGNPLLKFDGYYILGDLLEIPNLAQRGNRYWRYLIDRYVFDTDSARDFVATRGERVWLALYAPASFIYKQFILLAIAIFVASQYLAVGVGIAIWSISTCVILPAGKALWQVFAGPSYSRNRARVVSITSGVLLVSAASLLFVPAPLHTSAEGVLWLPETAQVRASTGGFVTRLVAESGALVSAGDALIEFDEPSLLAKLQIMKERVTELETRLSSERFAEPARATVTNIELANARDGLRMVREKIDRLVVRSRATGRFFVLNPQDLPGRYLKEGQLVGYVLPHDSRLVRATVGQADIALVRSQLIGTSVRFAEQSDTTLAGRIVREVPAGREELPSKALGGSGGGSVPVDPRDTNGTKALQRVFQFDIAVAADTPKVATFGSRAYIRFDHRWEPLGKQIWRRLRQLLLSRLEI